MTEPTRFQIEALDLQEKLNAALLRIEEIDRENELLKRQLAEAREKVSHHQAGETGWKRAFYRVQDALHQKEAGTR